MVELLGYSFHAHPGEGGIPPDHETSDWCRGLITSKKKKRSLGCGLTRARNRGHDVRYPNDIPPKYHTEPP